MNHLLEQKKIAKKSKSKVHACKCRVCREQCKRVCLGTPSDILRLIEAGYGDRILHTAWAAGMLYGYDLIEMYQPIQNENGCTFFKDGLCELHDLGLKPTEGKLSAHNPTMVTRFSETIAYQVAATWMEPSNAEIVAEIKSKIDY